MSQKVYLNWVQNRTPQKVEFTSLDALKSVMGNHIYNGEWVTDANGNKVDIDLRKICPK